MCRHQTRHVQKRETHVAPYMTFREEYRAKLHSTNPIVRLIGALLLEQNDEWTVQRPR